VKIKNKRIFIILIGCLCPIQNFAQSSDEQLHAQYTIKSFASTVGSDVLNVFSSPFRMSQKDIWQLSVFATITAGFITTLDEPIREEFVASEEDKNKGLLFVGKELVKIGDWYDNISSKYFLAGLSASMIAEGLIFKDQKPLETARLMIESYIITINLTSLGKGLFGRARPYYGRGASDFNFFKFSSQYEYTSMPSAHTSGIFSMMTVMAKQYHQWWIKIPAYTLSTSVALQRIDADQHWASDVIVGGALGYWVGSTLVNGYKKPSRVISFNPYLTIDTVGIHIDF
jgi:hypothetical protein